jgi:hypothetical protein
MSPSLWVVGGGHPHYALSGSCGLDDYGQRHGKARRVPTHAGAQRVLQRYVGQVRLPIWATTARKQRLALGVARTHRRRRNRPTAACSGRADPRGQVCRRDALDPHADCHLSHTGLRFPHWRVSWLWVGQLPDLISLTT